MLDGSLGIRDPELERPEIGPGPEIPPEVGEVGEELRRSAPRHESGELTPGGERRRDPGARQVLDELQPARGEARVAALEERRVGARAASSGR